MTEKLIEFAILFVVMTAWAFVLGVTGALVLRFANWVAGLIDRK